jgi:hypothetical protein
MAHAFTWKNIYHNECKQATTRQHGMQQLIRAPEDKTTPHKTYPTKDPSAFNWTSTDSLGRLSMPSVEVPRGVFFGYFSMMRNL